MYDQMATSRHDGMKATRGCGEGISKLKSRIGRDQGDVVASLHIVLTTVDSSHHEAKGGPHGLEDSIRFNVVLFVIHKLRHT